MNLETSFVDITRKHINKGIPGCGKECALALALKDQGFKDVEVGKFSVKLEGEKYDLSFPLQGFVHIFDKQPRNAPSFVKFVRRFLFLSPEPGRYELFKVFS